MNELAERKVPSFPQRRPSPLEPPPIYRTLRGEAPVSQVSIPSGGRAWVITRHEDYRRVLADPRLSSNRDAPGFPILDAGVRDDQADLVGGDGARRPLKGANPSSIIGMDDPEHGAARGAVAGEFASRRIRALRPRIQQIVDQCVDDLLSQPQPADLVATLALPVPTLTVCELLGVPYQDHAFFQEGTARITDHASTSGRRRAASYELRSYLDAIVTTKVAEPGDDLISRQITGKGGSYTEEDHKALVALAFLLLLSGYETTASMISLSAVVLLSHPSQLDAIRNDPAKTPGAVEELLRYISVTDAAPARIATEDIEISGCTIRAGEGVVPLGLAANRDPETFENPDGFDIYREARHHVAFGYGRHLCLRAPACSRLTRRCPVCGEGVDSRGL